MDEHTTHLKQNDSELASALHQKMAEDISAPAVFVADPEDGYRLLHANAACQSFGNGREATHLPNYIPTLTLVQLDELWESVADDRSVSMETEFRMESGPRLDVEIAFSQLEQNGRKLMMGYLRDITERKRYESRLRKQQEALTEAQRIAHVGSWTLDLVDDVLTWSDEIYSIFEIDPERFGASYETFLNAVHPDDREAVGRAYAEALANRRPYEIEHRLLMADGRVKYVLERCETRYADNGQPLLSQGTVQDITERKRMETELVRQAEFQKSMLDAICDVGMQLMVVESGRVIYLANRELARSAGYTDADIDAHPSLIDFIHPDDRPMAMDYHRRRLAGEAVPVSYELGLVSRAGERREYEVAAAVVPGTDPVRVITIGKDITERKRIGDTLKFVAQRGWKVVHGKSFLTEVARHLGQVLEVDYVMIDRLSDDSANAETIAIYAKGEVLPNMQYSLHGTPCSNVMDGDLCCYPASVQQRFPEDRLLVEMQVESYAGIPLWDSTGKVIGLIAVMDGKPMQDMAAVTSLLQLVATRVTAELEREQSARALAESRQFLNQIIDTIPDPVFVKDRMHRWIHLNQAFCEFIGHPLEILLGKSDYDFFPAHEADVFWAKDEAVFESGEENVNEEAFTDRDGNTHTIVTKKVCYTDEHGQQLLVGIIFDITARKRMEELLAQREQEFRSLAESSPNSIIRYDRDGRIRYLNTGLARFLDISAAEVIGKLPSEVWPDGRFDELQRAAAQAVETETEVAIEISDHIADGESKYHQIRVVPERDIAGQVIGTIAFGWEITDLKRYAQSLLERARLEQQLSGVAASVPGFIFTIRVAPDRHISFPFASFGIEALFGLRPEDIRDDAAVLRACYHPEDLPRVLALMDETEKTLSPFRIEIRIFHPEHGMRWIEIRSMPQRHGDGSTEWHGLMIDITERKVVEKQLARLNASLDHVNDTVLLIGEDASILYVNEEACHILGYPREQLQGMRIADIDPDYQLEGWPSHWFDLKTHGMLNFESRHMTSDGRIYPVDITANYVEFEGLGYNLAICRDITERKRAEDALLELNIHLEENARALEEQATEFEAQAVELEASQEQLKQTEAWYRGIVRSAPDGMVVVNERGHIILVNEHLEQMFGYGEGELLGQPMETLLPPDMRNGHVAKRNGFLASGAPGRPMDSVLGGLRACRKDGAVFPVDVSLSRLPDTDVREGAMCAAIRDVTERKRMEDVLAAREQEFRTLVENLPTYVVRLDHELRRIYANPAYVALVGIPEAEIMGTHISTFWRATNVSIEAYIALLARVLWSGMQEEVPLEWTDSHGQLVSHIVRVAPEYASDGEVGGLLILGVDITERRRQQMLEAERQRVFETMAQGGDLARTLEQVATYIDASRPGLRSCIMLLDADSQRLYSAAAPSFQEAAAAAVSGIDITEGAGCCAMAAQCGERVVVEDVRAHSCWASCQSFAAENCVRACWSEPILASTGLVLGVVTAYLREPGAPGNDDQELLRQAASLCAIAIERKRIEERMQRQASYDSLTGLPNRRLFGHRLREEVTKAERGGGNLALLFIDLDRFKEVNDTLGHDIGDLLLVKAAQRIQGCVRESDTVARLGGDEFIVILTQVEDVSHLGRHAQAIVEDMAQAFYLGEHTAYVSASIGIASYPADADSAENLIGCADQAMYAAKDQGRNNFSFFTPAMQQQVQTRLMLANDLREALAQGQLQVHYQPIVDIATGEVVKAEALLRWKHPQRGMVPPDQFIPIAEESGLIHDIGDWVFRQAVEVAKQSNVDGQLLRQISVNLSPRQFVKGDFDAAWLEYMQQIGFDPKLIVIEITEGLLLDDRPEIMEILARLGMAGMQIALDDFGTGYSAMAYLKKFPIDYLKIDRSFVRDLETDPGDRAIAEAIVVMARKLGLKVIAEGVETEGQRDLLAAVGCEYVQGYFYARPMPAEEFMAFVDGSENRVHVST